MRCSDDSQNLDRQGIQLVQAVGYKLKLFRWTTEIGTNEIEDSRHEDELAR